MAEFLSKSQVQVNAPQSDIAVKNLGADLMNLFGAVGKGAETYNVIGATTAKLEAFDKITSAKEELTRWDAQSKLTAPDDSQFFEAYSKKVQELTTDLVAHGQNTFSGHEAAYQAYNESATEFGVATRASKLPEINNMWQKALYNENKPKISQTIDAVALSAKRSDLESHSNWISVYNQHGKDEASLLVKSEYGSAILSQYETKVSATEPELLLKTLIGDEGQADPKKVVGYINGIITTELVSVKDNEDGTIAIKSDLGDDFDEKLSNKIQWLLGKHVTKEKDSGAWSSFPENRYKQLEETATSPSANLGTVKEAIVGIKANRQTIEEDPRYLNLTDTKKAELRIKFTNTLNRANQEQVTFQALNDKATKEQLASGMYKTPYMDAETLQESTIVTPFTLKPEDIETRHNQKYQSLLQSGLYDEASAYEQEATRLGYSIHGGDVDKAEKLVSGDYSGTPRSPQEAKAKLSQLEIAYNLGKIDDNAYSIQRNNLAILSGMKDDANFYANSHKIIQRGVGATSLKKRADKQYMVELTSEFRDTGVFRDFRGTPDMLVASTKDLLKTKGIVLTGNKENDLAIMDSYTVPTDSNFLWGGRGRVVPLKGTDTATIGKGVDAYAEAFNSGKAPKPKGYENLKLTANTMLIANNGSGENYTLYIKRSGEGAHVIWSPLVTMSPKTLKLWATHDTQVEQQKKVIIESQNRTPKTGGIAPKGFVKFNSNKGK